MLYRARGVHKSFGGIIALRGVDFDVRPRSVQAMIGENGAGKSTLLKILAGAMQPDSGSLELDGKPVSFQSTADALAEGIAIVSQELSLFPDVDILGNLFPLGAPARLGFVDRAEVHRRADGVLEDLGVDAPLDTPVGELPLAQQQLVEIARAVITQPRVLILDEPTSALDRQDVDHVHAVLDVLRDRNVGVVYVSHILEDVMGQVDEITVLRDGRVVLSAVPAESITMSEAITAMVGDSVASHVRRAPDVSRGVGPALEVSGVTLGSAKEVSLSIEPGEVVGFAGLAGAGQHDIFEAMAGISSPIAGTVTLPSGLVNPASIREAVKDGVAIVPGDRKSHGLHLDAPVWGNIGYVKSVALGSGFGMIDRVDQVTRADDRIRQFRIAASSANAITSSLSGGNQQKVVFAKWAETRPSVILMDDPTRGIDVKGRTEVWDLIHELADAGAVQVVLSSDPLELISICHRILVFRDGRVARELVGAEISHAAILEAMNMDTQEVTG